MGRYEKKLKEVVEEPGFKRLFYGTCKDCGKKIWSIGEQIDVDKGTIKALFMCNCGAKFKQTVYTRGRKGGYRYIQGLVTDYSNRGKKYRVIRSIKGMYLVTDNGVKVKKFKKGEENHESQ